MTLLPSRRACPVCLDFFRSLSATGVPAIGAVPRCSCGIPGHDLRVFRKANRAGFELCGDIVGPLVDRVPVARVACRHATERKPEFRRVDYAAEDRNRARSYLGDLRKRLVELCARLGQPMIIRSHRPEREDRQRLLRELAPVLGQEPSGVLVPAAEVQRASEDNAVVRRQIVDFCGAA